VACNDPEVPIVSLILSNAFDVRMRPLGTDNRYCTTKEQSNSQSASQSMGGSLKLFRE
jgi:hypothetical protein